MASHVKVSELVTNAAWKAFIKLSWFYFIFYVFTAHYIYWVDGDVWLHMGWLGLPLTLRCQVTFCVCSLTGINREPHESHRWKIPWTLQHAFKIKAPSASHICVGSGNYSALVLPRIHYLGPNCTNLTDINSNCSENNPLHVVKCTCSMFEQVPRLKVWQKWTWVLLQ